MTEWVLVPREPVDAQLTSMALTYDHGYGLRNAFERENIRLHMAQLHRAMLEAAPAAPQMTDAEMIRTEAWQSITDELAHAAYLRGIEEGKRQAAAPQRAEPVGDFQRSAPGKIWMNLGNDGMDEIEYPTWDALVRADENITWSEDRIDATDIPYVRADLAHPPAAEVQRLRDALTAICAVADDREEGNYDTVPIHFIRSIARDATKGGK